MWRYFPLPDNYPMKVTIIIDDGEAETTVSRNIRNGYLADVLTVFEDTLKATGFSYVNSLAAEKKDGSLTWSDT